MAGKVAPKRKKPPSGWNVSFLKQVRVAQHLEFCIEHFFKAFIVSKN